MKDTFVVHSFMEAKKLLESFGISVSYNEKLFSVQRYEGDKLVLFENFDTAAEMLAYARGYGKREEILLGGPA